MLAIDLVLIVLGLFMLYSIVHFFIIQHNKQWSKRKLYEKIVSVIAIASILLTYLGIMMEG
jgi:hypothetical protein